MILMLVTVKVRFYQIHIKQKIHHFLTLIGILLLVLAYRITYLTHADFADNRYEQLFKQH